MFTPDEITAGRIAHAFGRELEIHNYQTNIDLYSASLAVMPDGEWPEALAPFAATKIDDLPEAMPDDDVALVSSWQHRDRLRRLLRTERAEMAKSMLVLDVLKGQIGPDYPELLAAFKAEKAEQAAQTP